MNKEIKCVNNNCSDCQEWLNEKLAECEEWEVKRKESYRNFELRFCPNQSEGKSKVCHSETGGYNYHTENCPSCQAIIKIIKSNSHGDKTEELKEHAHAASCPATDSQQSAVSISQSRLPSKIQIKTIYPGF